MCWDFIVAVILILDKLLIWKIFVKICDKVAFINKARINFFCKIFSNIYRNKGAKTGGGLLIIAKN
jgi:hypothetical protein